MSSLIDLLIAPGAIVGAVAGLCLAVVFHWLAPEGIDTIAAGAWFVGVGFVAGLVGFKALRKRGE